MATFPLRQIQLAGARLQGLIGSYYVTTYFGTGGLTAPGFSAPFTLNPGTGLFGAATEAPICQINGSITATCSWVPDSSGDVPPNEALVYQYGYAMATDWTSPTATDGLGDPPTYSGGTLSQGSFTTAISTGYNYSVKDNPGSIFALPTINPAASGSEAPNTPVYEVAYQAYAIPITVSLSGTTPDIYGGKNILVGQDCTAALSCSLPGGATVDFENCQWTVSGPQRTFKDYKEYGPDMFGQSSATVDYLTAADWNVKSPKWAWLYEPGDSGVETVTGTGDLWVSGNFVRRVSASTTVRVWEPESELVPTPAFNTYMLYLPPNAGQGHEWVPLQQMSWKWNIAELMPEAGWGIQDLGALDAPVVTPCTQLPIWGQVINCVSANNPVEWIPPLVPEVEE